MTLGKRMDEEQEDLFIAAASLPRSPGHIFYQALNRLPTEAGFDTCVEERCEPLHPTCCKWLPTTSGSF